MDNSKKLMPIFIGAIVLDLLIVIAYETEMILEGALCGDVNAEFLTTITMELLTICEIPLALRLFKFESVRSIIKNQGAAGHFQCALVRMAMLMIPLMINIICYYLFVKVTFLYLAIIIAISLVFIIPTKSRCDSEL